MYVYKQLIFHKWLFCDKITCVNMKSIHYFYTVLKKLTTCTLVNPYMLAFKKQIIFQIYNKKLL